MAFTRELRNVSPDGARSLNIDGHTVVVGAGDTLQVTPEAAGRAPHWRRVATHPDDDTTLDARDLDGKHVRQHAGHVEVFDLGEGLLAQTSNWIPADVDPDDDRPDPLATGTPLALGDPLPAGLLVGEQGPEPIVPPADGTATTEENS